MAETDNETILASTNQIVQAITELALEVVAGNIKVNVPSNAVKLTSDCGCPGAGGPGPNLEPGEAAEPAGGEVPDGFPGGYTYEDYLEYKCNAANMIIDDLIQTCANMGTLGGVVGALSIAALYTFLNTSLLGGLLVGVMAIGFSAFTAASIIIAALIAIIVAGAGGLAYFITMSENLEDIREDMICTLFSSENVSQAKSGTVQHIDDARTGITSLDEFVSDKIAEILGAMLNNSVYNILFEYSEDAEAYEGSYNCSDCNEPGCPPLTMSLGTWDEDDIFTSVMHPTIATHIISVVFNGTIPSGIEYCGPPVTITGINILAGTPSEGLSAFGYRFVDQAGANIYNGNSPTFPIANVGQLIIRDNTAPLNTIIAEVAWS